MALSSPDILIIGNLKFGTTTVVETFSSASSIYNGTNLTYNAEFNILPQSTGWPNNINNPETYTAYDIEIGFMFALPSGKTYEVTSISVSDSSNASIDIRDTDLKEYINSIQETPDNLPEADTYGIFFRSVDNVYYLNDLTAVSTAFPDKSYWVEDLLGTSITNLSGGTSNITNNVNNYLITATGTNTLNGEANLRFDGSGLMIGGTGSAQAKLQITGSGDLILIKNLSGSGIKVNDQGVLQLLSYNGEPTAIGGGMYYSGSNFFIGID
jgi:hypothetical protein